MGRSAKGIINEWDVFYRGTYFEWDVLRLNHVKKVDMFTCPQSGLTKATYCFKLS